MRLLVLICLLLTTLTAGVRPLSTPAGPGSIGPSLAVRPDGGVILSWLEPAGKTWALRWSALDPATLLWSESRTIASGADWFVNWADFPTITPLGDGNLLAIWFVENPSVPEPAGDHGHGAGYRAEYSISADDGGTWSPPQRITGESRVTEFAAAAALGDNARALVAWLDGRARPHGPQQLYAQTFLADGPDKLVDPSVCDCCQLAFARTTDSFLLAYRGRTEGEVRDIRLARWRDGRWEAPRPLHDDNWVVSGCPVNGPRLAAKGDDVVAVWHTAAGGEPRVLARRSRDGAATFGPVLRIDIGRPLGRVDVLQQPDGSAFVIWLEAAGDAADLRGGLTARIITPDGQTGAPRLLAPMAATRAGGFPRLAPWGDGEVLIVHTTPEGIAALLVKPD